MGEGDQPIVFPTEIEALWAVNRHLLAYFTAITPATFVKPKNRLSGPCQTERFGGHDGPREDPGALAIFAEYGIQVVPAHVMPFVGQTSAIATLDRTRSHHGRPFSHIR
jgi:hypothetical protein